jgi:hypothetical protein
MYLNTRKKLNAIGKKRYESKSISIDNQHINNTSPNANKQTNSKKSEGNESNHLAIIAVQAPFLYLMSEVMTSKLGFKW